MHPGVRFHGIRISWYEFNSIVMVLGSLQLTSLICQKCGGLTSSTPLVARVYIELLMLVGREVATIPSVGLLPTPIP